VLQGRSQASTCLEVAEVAGCRGLGPNLRENVVCFGRPAPREQNVHERDAAEREKTRHTGVLERAQCIRLRVGQRSTAQAGVRTKLSRHRERRQRPVLLRPLDHLGADPHLIVVSVREEEHERRNPEPPRLGARILEQSPISERLQGQITCIGRRSRSSGVVRRDSDLQALPDRSRCAGCDDEPFPRRLVATPDGNAAPRGCPSRRLESQPLFALGRWEIVDDRREIGQRLLRPLCQEER
jgi:hypothetical protein